VSNIGKNGVEEIVEIELNDKEKASFAKSADAVRQMNDALKSILAKIKMLYNEDCTFAVF
jgi:malate/lactate dehydrogenase